MGIRDFHIKLKAFRVKRFFFGRRRNKWRGNKPSWMIPISHGHHVVEHHVIKGGSDDDLEFDSVVIQREQMDHTELWYFGIFDAVVGDGVTKFVQSHFFGKKLKECHMRRKGKETLKRAYLGVRTKIREALKPEEETCRIEMVSLIRQLADTVIQPREIGIADSFQCWLVFVHTSHNECYACAQKVRMIACESGNTTGTKHSKGSELVVGGDRIDCDTEFLILASNGIWEGVTLSFVESCHHNWCVLVAAAVVNKLTYQTSRYTHN
ncbi:hypothetical protein V8G54_028539 [Vigna mungo]|uniref:PPM-type phosphatase domain-containing protein n=1 Tax=Vigna mungo TaxID=3915 RepID=A0AAQ3RKY3_VIGMU